MIPDYPGSAIVPRPVSQKNTGGMCLLGEGVQIVTPPEFLSTAELLAQRLRRVTNWPVPLNTRLDQQREGQVIEFRHDAGLADREAYTLQVIEDGAVISASSSAGAYYGSQTMLQLLPAAVYGDDLRLNVQWRMPTVEIEDAPGFRWRSVMLDSVRHFQPIEYIRKFIDVLSQHKINIFHWHLTDDQGWRIEIKKYPLLTGIGSCRRETMRGHQFHTIPEGDGKPIEGYYTQDEIRDLVAYAAVRNVQILPEIEMPGHAQAAVAAYPHLGLRSDRLEVSSRWGIHETLFNVRPETISFLQDVLDEVVALFPFEYLHIGGDEAKKKQWQEDAETQARMKELGLKDEEELQGWFIAQMAEFVHTRGKKLIGWDEILEAELPKGTRVMSWRDETGAIKAAKKGHEAIMCASHSLYFNLAQTKASEMAPLDIGGFAPLEKVYAFEPVPKEMPEKLSHHVIGVQGHLWTEYIPNLARLEHMAFPRISALADIAWSSKDRPPFQDFLRRLKDHLRRLDCQEVHYFAPLEEFSGISYEKVCSAVN